MAEKTFEAVKKAIKALPPTAYERLKRRGRLRDDVSHVRLGVGELLEACNAALTKDPDNQRAADFVYGVAGMPEHMTVCVETAQWDEIRPRGPVTVDVGKNKPN